jgi:hypothetical protein
MIKRIREWLAFQRYSRAMTRVILYVLKQGMENAVTTQDEGLHQWYCAGLETLVDESNRNYHANGYKELFSSETLQAARR